MKNSRADINRVVRGPHLPKPNFTKAELQALSQLKKDRTRIVLTTDKGVALVVIDRKEYIDKATYYLSQPVYMTIDKDPINRLKAKLITLLRQLKRETGLEDHIYKYMYPTGCSPPKLYGLPKIHKANTPLRPIVSSRGSVTYGVAKVLATILKHLVEKSLHHVHSTKDFVERVRLLSNQGNASAHMM